MGARPNGFNLLNVPGEIFENLGPELFFQDVNAHFINWAIQRDGNILMATKPGFVPTNPDFPSVLMKETKDKQKLVLSGFGRDYLMLRKNGYMYKDGQMVRK